MTTKITIIISSFLSLLVLSPAGKAITEDPADADTSTPITMTPAMPATLADPGPSAADSNTKLDPETQIRIALQQKLEGRSQEALGTLELAIDDHPDNARLYAVRGSILLEQGRIAPALSDLEKSVDLDPNDAEALVDRGEAYRRFGRMDLALGDLDRAIEIQPNNVTAHLNRGTLRFGKKDLQGALEDFASCIAVDPELPAPYFSRAVVQNALGNRLMATFDLERYLEVETQADLRKQAQAILNLWRNQDKAKNVGEEVQPESHL